MAGHSYFDHCYRKILDEEIYFSLGNRGFLVSDRTVEHEDQQISRFIKFPKRFASPTPPRYQYLEFTVQPLVNDKEQASDRQPGFSLGFTADLLGFARDNAKVIAELSGEYSHKNYDWQNSTDRRPGWNFITFMKPLIENIYVWATEYEKRPGIPPAEIPPIHPNGVDHFLGVLWQVDATEIQALNKICNGNFSDGCLTLGDKSSIFYGMDDLKILPSDDHRAFAAAIFTCRNWQKFVEMA